MRLIDFSEKYFEKYRNFSKLNNLFGDSIFLYFGIFLKEKNFIVVENEEEALRYFNKLSSLYKDNKIFLFREWDKLFFDNTSPSEGIESSRINVLHSILKSDSFITVCTVKSFFSRILSSNIIENNIINLKKGELINLSQTIEKLINTGYLRKESVENVGEFSVRGEILDIWVESYENPVRIDCGFDEINEITSLNPVSNLTIKNLFFDEILILPATEIIKDSKNMLDKFQDPNIKITDLYDNYPEIYNEKSNIFKYINDYTVFFIEDDRIKQNYEIMQDEFEEFGDGFNNFVEKYDFGIFDKVKRISNFKDYGDKYLSDINSVNDFNKDMSELSETIIKGNISGKSVIFCFETRSRFLRMKEILSEYSIDLQEENQYFTGKKEVFGFINALNKGFEIDDKIIFIGEENIWGKSVTRELKKKKIKKRMFDIFTELEENDFVVHVNHGIGRYRGIKKIRVGKLNKEFFVVEYAKGDTLFVPIENADVIHKYIGSENPTLYTLDGKRWGSAKKKVRKKVKEIAKDLIKLYSERMKAKGFVFKKDCEWQHELEASFSYEETEDQIKVLSDIKEDMEKNFPMDRLVCGDVGFGKTELAIRAAFKAIMSGKQVAVLAPTTILATQHLRTFGERYNMFPVKMACLSRLNTTTENRDIKDRLKEGELDLVVGTHKLLSKDINFKELGLLIVDEEQRFGVKHKERLKEIKKNIDVLTMTATPIPRTLNMALNGIRDISIIETAPDNRTPIKTYVIPFSEGILKEAILRETERGGQVYYLHNNVSNISYVRAKLEEKFDNISFKTAHGQMNRKELNEIMDDFLNKKFEVLVTTTIIESGIDIPNVNTIIVENANRFGLSQLYQLKGRVGRSERQAYAYLFYKKDEKLTKSATERLKTLRENTKLGSGFKIAMKDLEIRGAGNVFGKAQHGFVDEVGFEMYCKILKEVVAEEKGEVYQSFRDITFKIPVNAYIPDYMVQSKKSKIDLYKKVANIITMEEYNLVLTELKDIYRRLPVEVLNLLKLQKLKVYGRKCGLKEIYEYDYKNICLKFYSLEFSKQGLSDFLERFSDNINLSIHVSDAVVIKKPSSDYGVNIELIENILHYMQFCVII